MSVGFYFDAACTNQVSSGTKANPWKERFNGDSGETKQRQLWMKNDNDPANRTFKNLLAKAVGEVAGVNIQFAEDNAGVPGAWGETLPLADGDYLTAGTFWVSATVDAGVLVQNFKDLQIEVEMEEESTI